MEAIELTTRQQKRLIRMSNKLFPNREWRFVKGESGMFGHNISRTEKRTYHHTEIHWVEFMLFHLMPRLTKKSKKGIHIDFKKILNEEINLIDYVFENIYRTPSTE